MIKSMKEVVGEQEPRATVGAICIVGIVAVVAVVAALDERENDRDKVEGDMGLIKGIEKNR